ncbi:hypothetical protein CEUSTIGMA_g1624.t1 [Chlamydomonas eustigma]|uniref:EGF-like domain-containing protein n=1 Tax=Chlamydomonas eustigma TaxID=1157962 RepID=A0A250WTP0_9CHLO|nr:hypothetical protein CEUSTIGMA_g1624.t1 [Chlamydomonas eustigma]|eukprot:GAX74175.1 hypothetical protein CEUSTIGMA_g1624.t1 [Chlamydomonas eustigma]
MIGISRGRYHFEYIAIFALIFVVLFGDSLADPTCNDHGDLIDGKCVCTTAKPEAQTIGYVGDHCSIPVYYHAASSDAAAILDVLPSCYGAPCTTLTQQQEVCFYVALSSLLQTSAHFGLLLSAKDGAALDLKGLFSSEGSSVYPTSSNSYNFATSTSSSKSRAALSFDKEEVGSKSYSGVYMCVTYVGETNTTFELRTAALGCPFELKDESTVSVCSSSGPSDVRQEGSMCPTGVCSCTGQWNRPQSPTYEGQWSRPQSPTYEGLGFDECSAASLQLPNDPTSTHHVDHQAPGTWSFFNFTVDESVDRYTVATVTATDTTSSDLEMYFKYWQAPGRHVTQFDRRSDPGDFRRRSNSADLSSSLNLDKSCDCSTMLYRPGVWFLGVFVNGADPVSYDMKLTKTSCPNDCSGERGTCNKDTGECTCAKDIFSGKDCSITKDKLELGTPYSSAPRTGFTGDQFELAVGDILSAAPGNSLSLSIEVSFSSGSKPLPAWVTSRPGIFFSGATNPSWENSAQHVTLPEADTKYTIHVEASQVPSGTLYIAFYNPLSQPYEIGYSLTVTTSAHCINGCSGHGTCNEAGKCVCVDGFTGVDCAVDVEQLQKQSCIEGSLKQAISVSGGKGYAVCVCTAPEQCAYSSVADDSNIGQAVVVCDAGFEIKGAVGDAIKLSDGRAVSGGGKCIKVKKGTSGGMVFFYCVLSIALFCGMVIGGKYGLEWYQLKRAAQVGGYSDIGTGESTNLWDAFTGSRRAQNNDSW